MEVIKNRDREIWVDNVKIIACILVVLGHFFQSMIKSNIIQSNNLNQWFNQTIYYFHVPLFFICSGYLYQKLNIIQSWRAWRKNIEKKILALGIPYLTFSIITWILKVLFSSSVNDQPNGLIYTLFINPLSPYWYLYILFFMFLITPTLRNKKNMVIEIVIALILSIVTNITNGENTYFRYLFTMIGRNYIWFVIGMSLQILDFYNKVSENQTRYKRIVILCGVFFIGSSILVYLKDIEFVGLRLVLGFMACMSVIVWNIIFLKKSNHESLIYILTKYTMPVFLMHTIFAASFRGLLIKFRIDSQVIHFTIGLVVSFIGPIIATQIMSCFKGLEFLIYPAKYVKIDNTQ